MRHPQHDYCAPAHSLDEGNWMVDCFHKHCCVLAFDFLGRYANPLNGQHPARLSYQLSGTWRGRKTSVNRLVPVMFAKPLTVKSFASDLGVVCHLPASMKWYPVNLLACKWGEIPYPSLFDSPTFFSFLFFSHSSSFLCFEYDLPKCNYYNHIERNIDPLVSRVRHLLNKYLSRHVPMEITLYNSCK